MNQQALLKKVKKLQDEMMTTQKQIEQTSFYASAGGVVNVEVKGTKELVKVSIEEDFEVEAPEDLEMLSDMVVAACNQAYKEIEKVTKEKMGVYNEMLGGFGGFF
ncbi:MAG TPA: YbaB/EbfC family nucleoid-associated protein [Bacilli bacterium]|nr:MAG: Nucleoid-associated protein [Tenericutes bacterium ADurb.BinA124]HNZ50058.1 YbaB/EbfC family nucleoid-associated protein [Bacilli bacterium]HPN60573.1 YbaB/EbfC family nucleoid-associated protein [Bacilli bacterium]HPX84809.1 YbaB/EbfC family nucleoid-associated protein [Bacilli bacterium]HQC74213.1 YbaB/EbfC family nucleoid-associated protein [Bacilli bacterium]